MRIIFLIVFSVSTFAMCQGQRKETWIQDIEYFSEQFPKKHIDFYKIIDSMDFHHDVENLKSKVDSLKDEEIVIELQRIIAKLKVAHTKVSIGSYKKIFNLPILLEYFDDGLFIIGIDSSLSQYLGKKVIAINNIPIEIIEQKLDPYISHENKYWLRNERPKYLIKPQVLCQIGIVSPEDDITYILSENKQVTFPYEKINAKMAYIPIWTKMTWLKNQNKNYWFDTLQPGYLYIQYNSCREDDKYLFQTFVKDVMTTIGSQKIKNVLVDLRLNSGGNSEVIKPLLKALRTNQDIKYYAAISKRTFSSGNFAAIALKKKLNAILIGEPTGNDPNSYGNTKTFRLPNSKISIIYSNNYYSMLQTKFNYVNPDIRIKYKFKDLLHGKDLVLDYFMNE